MLLYFFTICFLIIYMIGLKCLCLQFKGHWFPSGYSTRIVSEGISPLSVAYAGLCKCCTLVFKNIVFPQTSKEIWNSVNSFVKVPCLGNGKWIWSIESKSKWFNGDNRLGWLFSYTIHDYHMVIDDLDIFYPPYPSQLVVDVYQNVKHVFGVCIFCPHFDIILHSVHSCRGFYFPKLNISWMQEDVKHWRYGHYTGGT